MASIGNNSILIAGGANFNHQGNGDEIYGQGFVLDLTNMQMVQVFDRETTQEFRFFCNAGNQVFVSTASKSTDQSSLGDNTLYALVEDQENKLNLISYSRG